ncbi:MAG: hypothetical protein KDA60_21500, partial [Planctomycetales bacterium]|nr:hypothetical protein [Planctomycetales bacterium]
DAKLRCDDLLRAAIDKTKLGDTYQQIDRFPSARFTCRALDDTIGQYVFVFKRLVMERPTSNVAD